VREKTALHGIVIDDQNTFTHDATTDPHTAVPKRALSPGPVNA
jgi:hypothetical protein